MKCKLTSYQAKLQRLHRRLEVMKNESLELELEFELTIGYDSSIDSLEGFLNDATEAIGSALETSVAMIEKAKESK